MASNARLAAGGALLCLGLVYATLSVGTSWAHLLATLLGRRDGWDAGDFATVYSAGRLVAMDRAREIYNLDALTAIRVRYAGMPVADRIAYLNPPFFAGALAPLSTLNFSLAYQLWSGMSIALALVTCGLVWRNAEGLSRWQRTAVVAALVTAYPLAYALRLGQFSVILMTSWFCAYLLLRSGRDRAAGVALAVLLIKPELLLPPAAFLLWKRRYGVFATLLPLAAAAVAASFLLMGLKAALEYPVFIIENARAHQNGTRTDYMFGWNGWLGAMLGKEQPLRTTLLSLPLTVATLAGTAAAWRGPLRVAGARFPTQWLALTLATVLVDPNLFIQDTIIILPVAAMVLAATVGRTRTAIVAGLALGWLLSTLGLDPGSLWHFNPLTTLIAASFAALVWRDVRAQRESARPREAFQHAEYLPTTLEPDRVA